MPRIDHVVEQRQRQRLNPATSTKDDDQIFLTIGNTAPGVPRRPTLKPAAASSPSAAALHLCFCKCSPAKRRAGTTRTRQRRQNPFRVVIASRLNRRDSAGRSVGEVVSSAGVARSIRERDERQHRPVADQQHYRHDRERAATQVDEVNPGETVHRASAAGLQPADLIEALGDATEESQEIQQARAAEDPQDSGADPAVRQPARARR